MYKLGRMKKGPGSPTCLQADRSVHIRITSTVLFALAIAICGAKLYPSLFQHFFHATADMGLRVQLTRVLIIIPLALLPLMWIVRGFDAVNDWLHRHRWQIGGIIVLLAVLLDVSGSSLCIFNAWNGGSLQQDVVFGIPRLIRSDEWLVNTPRAFSQSYSNYSYFNSIQGATPSDMFIIKEAPVWAAAEIFRPFHWGYLLLGSSRGLAFYWSSRLVVLFLCVYELCLWLSRSNPHRSGRRDLAVLGAGLVTFSPLVQWWFAVNSLPEMIIALCVATLALDRFCTDHAPLHRFGWCLLIAWCAGMFILTLYPAWQIPLAWVIVLLLVAVIVKNWGHIRVTGKDGLSITISAAALIGLLATVLVASKPTIIAMLGTSYPGVRNNTGGDYPLTGLFTGATTMLSSFTNLTANSTEISYFLDLFPLGIILCVISWIRRRHADFLTVSLIALDAFYLIYCTVGIPLWLSKITLMTQSSGSRARMAFALINILLLVIGAARCANDGANQTGRTSSSDTHVCWAWVIGGSLVITLLNGICAWLSFGRRALVLTFTILMVTITALAVLLPVARTTGTVKYAQTTLITIATAVICLCGLAVNPVQQGARELTDQPVVTTARTVEQQHGHGTWMTTGDNSWIEANLFTGNGITTANSVAVTPNKNLWARLDADGRDTAVYNRYAFITAYLDGDVHDTHAQQKTFELNAPDHFTVHLTADDLHRLGITYVVDSSGKKPATGTHYTLKEVTHPIPGFWFYQVVKK